MVLQENKTGLKLRCTLIVQRRQFSALFSTFEVEFIMQITIFGLGYVGTTSMACLAELGHVVVGVDVNAEKVALVNEGASPVYEPGVAELISKYRDLGQVRATTDLKSGLSGADAVLICVGTPSSTSGAIDSSHLMKVIEEISAYRIETGRMIPFIVRSTALPAIHEELINVVGGIVDGKQPIAYCVHPEFLREGQAIDDFMSPPKIIFGCTDEAVESICHDLYPGIDMKSTFTDPKTAGLAKYADNCFHAVKVTFANEIGMLAKAQGVDARKVMEIFCQDTKLNLSSYYLRPGFSFGGSCLPKDLRAVLAWGRQNAVSVPMLENVLSSNTLQTEQVIDRILATGQRNIGLFGLAFKDNTDDLRESPMVTLAERLLGKGLAVRIYDPALSIGRMVGANRIFALSSLPHLAEMLHDDAQRVVKSSDVVVLARPFSELDWVGMPWREDHQVIDLQGVGSLKGVNVSTDGIYWA